jgi:hypothetical protein
MKDEAREKQTFDVFLSHNSKDKATVPLYLLAARAKR